MDYTAVIAYSFSMAHNFSKNPVRGQYGIVLCFPTFNLTMRLPAGYKRSRAPVRQASGKPHPPKDPNNKTSLTSSQTEAAGAPREARRRPRFRLAAQASTPSDGTLVNPLPSNPSWLECASTNLRERGARRWQGRHGARPRPSRAEEHTSELHSPC